MHRFTTYCDLAFLDQYTRIKPDKDVLDYNEEDRLWIVLLDFLKKDTDVIVNIPKDELSPALFERHPILRRLHDRPRSSGTQLSFDSNAFSSIEEKAFHEGTTNPWRLFLLNNTATPPAQLSAAYGALFLDASGVLETWDRIGRPALLDVSDRGETPRFSWKDLERFAAPLTSLLVCDPYLLKVGRKAGPEQMLENIASLVVSLLPEGQNQVCIEIMLVTGSLDDEGKLERICPKLENKIRKGRPALDFSLSLVEATGMQKYHDRHVFMNYGFVKSGISFNNYFNKGKLRTSISTTISFDPVLDSGRLQTVMSKLRELARIVDNAVRCQNVIGNNVVGSKENALLRAAQQSAETDVGA